jgi:outer membrane protein OmpA-like peptidoglycan-associated protein
MNMVKKTGIVVGTLFVLSGCSSLPDRVDTLEQARASVRTMEQDDLASEVASRELAAARDAIAEADAAYKEREPLELIEHKAYVAQRYADISQERLAEAHAKEQIARGEAERNEVRLQSRTREAEAAEREARAAGAEAQAAQRQAEASAQEAQAASERNRQLEQELADLQAKQTERGLVLTLGDVLFDTNQATLKPGAAGTLDKIAEFMRDYPDRHVLIEGHTDARGADDYNLQLSERRAGAVREALADRGIEVGRIRSVGLGEAYPIAGNDTAAGMQENRRVEIVISDENGSFPGAVERSAQVR